MLWLGVIDTPIRIMFTPSAVIIGLVYILLPFMVMPLYSSIENWISLCLRRRAIRCQQVADIYPHHYPTDDAGNYCRMSAGDAASDGPVLCIRPDGRRENLLIGNVIKVQFLNIRDWPFGAATSITLTIVMGLMLLVYWRASRLLNKKVELE